MEFNNVIRIMMENNEVANTALDMIKKVLCSGDFSRNYRNNTAEILANDLQVKGSQIIQEDYKSYFIVEDIDAVMESVLKAIAGLEIVREFKCDVISESTYSEGEFEASYKNGLLKIKNTYYPCGHWEYLSCPVCGEDIVRLEDFDPSKEYICPKCGEVVDLRDEYEETVPCVEEKEFFII